MNMNTMVTVAAMVAAMGFARSVSAGDYSAEKRCIHEQMTGQRLDENGKPVREVSQNDAISEGKTSRRLKASSPLKVSNVRMSQRANSKWVDVYYDLTGGNGTL